MAKPDEIGRGIVFPASPPARLELHDRNQPRDRRRPDARRAAVILSFSQRFFRGLAEAD
jgi:hypothetical protein